MFTKTTEIGTKAKNLKKMIDNNINVPNFFIITYEDYFNNKQVSLDKLKSSIEYIKGDFFAIRSSANVEDSSVASFAGMFKTLLNIPKKEINEAIDEIFNCWKNDIMGDYCKFKKISVNDIKMCIIVQQQIPSEISGVCISRVDFNQEYLCIEACYGQCAAITDGSLTPVQYLINRKTLSIVQKKDGFQDKILVCSNRSGLIEQERTIQKIENILSDCQIKEIISVIFKLERLFGNTYLDVEWTIYRGKLYILQVRPYVQNL